jgi:hypothetical protein
MIDRSPQLVEVSCLGKDKLTAAIARRVAKRSQWAQVSAYRCEHCGHWHVGKHLVKTKNMGKRR